MVEWGLNRQKMSMGETMRKVLLAKATAYGKMKKQNYGTLRKLVNT